MKRKSYLNIILSSAFAMILGLAVACSPEKAKEETEPDPEPEPEEEVDVIPVSKGAYKHVIILGVDGGGAFFSHILTPNVFDIFKNYAFTYQSKASYPTISAQNWGSMLHGVLPEFHGLTNSKVASQAYPVNSPYPSIFRVVREAMPDAKLASFCDWNCINFGIIENNLDVEEGTGSDPEVTEMAKKSIYNTAPTLLFVQFDSADGAGHSYGYGSDQHLAAMSNIDGMIGEIYDAMVAKGIADETLLIVSCDHGGTPAGSHGGNTYAERYVFLGVYGKTTEQKCQIIDAETRDIPAIAAYALGLDCPDTWSGHVPSGVFQGVTADERKETEIPVSENRKHKTVATPSLDKMQSLLKTHNVLAYLPFDGNADDLLGGKTTVPNGKLYYYDAYFGQGVALDDGYITVKDASFSTNSFSVAFWLKASSTSDDPSIISNKDWDNGYNDGWVLSLRPGDIKFNAGYSATSSRIDAETTLPLDYDQGWMHVALVVDRTAFKIHVYYDFEEAGSFDIDSSMKTVSYDALDLTIGQDGRGKYKYSLPAQVDEMIIVSDVLKESDIEALKKYYTE